MLESAIDAAFVKPTTVQSIMEIVRNSAVADEPPLYTPKAVVADPNTPCLVVPSATGPTKAHSPQSPGASAQQFNACNTPHAAHPINIVVGGANGHATVFMDVENNLLNANVRLNLPPPESESDIVSSVVGYRHTDFNGEATCNVLVAYGKRLLLFCGSGPTTLKLTWCKEFESPILRAALSDITGDFVPEMIVLTLTSCHVLQQTLLFNDISQSVKEELRQLVRIQHLEAAIRKLVSTRSLQQAAND